MPLVQITLLQGRTVEQKRKVAERITQAMVEEAKVTKEAVVVTFIEVTREDYASGGVLMADKECGAFKLVKGGMSRLHAVFFFAEPRRAIPAAMLLLDQLVEREAPARSMRAMRQPQPAAPLRHRSADQQACR